MTERQDKPNPLFPPSQGRETKKLIEALDMASKTDVNPELEKLREWRTQSERKYFKW